MNIIFKKNLKTILAIIMVIVNIFGTAVCVSAFNRGSFDYIEPSTQISQYYEPFGDFSYAVYETANGKHASITGYSGDADVLEIPEEIEGLPVKAIGKAAFAIGMHKFKKVIVPDSVVYIAEDAFYDCEHLEEIVFGNGLKAIGPDAFSGVKRLKKITFPESLESLGDGNFTCSKRLKEITLPDSLEVLGDGAFAYCKKLEKISGGKNLKEIGTRVFYKTAYFYNSDNWTNYGLYFRKYLLFVSHRASGKFTVKNKTVLIASKIASYHCPNVTEIVVPDSVKYISKYAFSFENLKKVTLGKNIEKIGYDIFPMSDKSIYDKKSAAKGMYYIGPYLIHGFRNKAKSIVKNGTTLIADNAFYYDRKLKNVVLPETLKYIGDYSFAYCEKLKNVELPEGLLKIGKNAFAFCENLKSINIPESVVYLGKNAFVGCTALENPSRENPSLPEG